MCEACETAFGANPDMPPEILGPYTEIFHRITELTSEQRLLFIDDAVGKVQKMLSDAQEQPEPKKAMMTEMAVNTLNLIGFANATESEQRGFTSTGDVKAAEVWNDWVDLVMKLTRSAMAITPDDVPREVIERFAKGEATAEDRAVLGKALAEKGVDPAAANVEMMVQTPDGIREATDEERESLSKSKAEAKSADQPDKGYGLYL